MEVEYEFDTESGIIKNWQEKVVSESESSPFYWINNKHDKEIEEIKKSVREASEK